MLPNFKIINKQRHFIACNKCLIILFLPATLSNTRCCITWLSTITIETHTNFVTESTAFSRRYRYHLFNIYKTKRNGKEKQIMQTMAFDFHLKLYSIYSRCTTAVWIWLKCVAISYICIHSDIHQDVKQAKCRIYIVYRNLHVVWRLKMKQK